MKNVLRKVQIAALALLLGFGAGVVINGTSVQSTSNNQYVLSRDFSSYNLTHSRQSWQWQYTITPTQSLQSQSTITRTTTTSTTTPSLPANTQASRNWAGYVVTPASGSNYTSISGSWTVPNITTSNRNAVAAQWVGLGGVNSTDLLQMGTIEELNNGQPIAEVFWEQLPDVAQYVMSVPIGSKISVNISETASSSSTWNLTVTANTPDNQTLTKTVAATLDSYYAQGIGTSAEWISEDPSNANGKLVPLANMGTVDYQSATVNGQPLNASGNNVQLVALTSSNGSILIAPSTLGTDGESFTTSTETTSSTPKRVIERLPQQTQKHYIIRFHWGRR